MFKAAILGFIGISSVASFEFATPPHTNIGNASIACNPASAPQKTNGFATYFSDNTYACEKWNHKAKDLPDCFVALNGVCGMKTS